MRNIDKLKQFIKETAQQIRTTRFQYKEAQRNPNASINIVWKLLGQLYRLKRDARHHHIAYCELRGRTRDQIEKPRDNNSPNERLIKEIKEKYAWSEEEIAAYEERKARCEALCLSA